jgi:hypothetical protein
MAAYAFGGGCVRTEEPMSLWAWCGGLAAAVLVILSLGGSVSAVLSGTLELAAVLLLFGLVCAAEAGTSAPAADRAPEA